MKLILFSLSLLFVLQNAHAWSVESRVHIGDQGMFKDTVTLYCRPDESLCQEVCQTQDSCWKEQELCFNCLGTSNPILRTVFTEVDRLYRNAGRVLSSTESGKVFSQGHIFISARSIYNFYSALDNQDVRTRFQALCLSSSLEPLIVLEKNKNHEPSRIKYVICEGTGPYNQGMYILEYNPLVVTSPESINLNTKF